MGAPDGVQGAGLDELQDLLVGRERAHLAAIQARLDDPDARRRDVGEVLPEVLLQHALDPEFAHALAPGVERAITSSVRENPAPLADALFPVMGPAIRKAVAAGLASMVETLSRTLEQSVSWRSILWRVEGVRTGRPFAEIVLSRTLLYRVEQVFLIDRASGLLLHHVHEGPGEVRDVDMVSGMLTAIRDFVQDSFRATAAEGGLEVLRVGDLSVWIEQGPRAVIASVLRGVAPREYRSTLQTAIETIHLEFTDAFEHFSGDADPFKESGPVLESCLHTEYRPEEAGSRRRVWIVAGAVAAGVAVWLGLSLRDRMRWDRYLDSLRAQPGLVVVSEGRRGGRFSLTGLRDPLSPDPASLLAQANLAPEDVAAQWEPYHAAHPTIALARARAVLQPPDGVTVDLRDGVLHTAGTAPPAWLTEAAKLAPLIPGIARLDASGSIDYMLAATGARMTALTPLFIKGQAQLVAGQDEVIRQLRQVVTELQAVATTASRRFRLEVIGHTDSDGPPEANLPLSRARADVVRAALASVGGDRLEIVSAGVGAGDPAVAVQTEVDKQRNRRVTVRLTPIDSPR